VDGSVTIDMHRSSAANPRPVNTYIFGTAAVQLPPKQTTELSGDCTMRESVQLIAAFPHMHVLGQSQRFEVGSSAGAMKEVFKRDLFSFDSQRIDTIDLKLAPGDLTRVTCAFNNTTDQAVTYGESTKDEMCYFLGFAIDRPTMSACIAVLPPLGGR
jgi:hypothetical protein